MTGDQRMFNSIDLSDSNEFESIIFGDNGKGKVKGGRKDYNIKRHVHLKIVCL
jgi:hypothetical protein